MLKATPFFKLTLPDEAASQKLGEDLAACLRHRDCVLLEGTLGIGKTTIARATIQAYLDDEMIEVPSPSFTLANLYQGDRSPLTHFDLFRLMGCEDLDEIGFFDSLQTGVTLVEWPEHGGEALPAEALRLRISQNEEGRLIEFFGPQPWQGRMRRNLAIRYFLDQCGWVGAKRRLLQGDASSRTYERITRMDGKKAVLMNSPALDEKPNNKERIRYAKEAHLAQDVYPFYAIGEALRKAHLPAPEIYARNLREGFLLLEDFGQETIVDQGPPQLQRYKLAIDILIEMHGRNWPAQTPLPNDRFYSLPPFDKNVFTNEISLLREWYVPKVVETEIKNQSWKWYFEVWGELFEDITHYEKSWILRDYHSPNLMWRANKQGINSLGLIDYQDALVGPSVYDVASLCQDARYTIPEDMENTLKQHYKKARSMHGQPFDDEQFECAYAIIAAQRATRLLGLWPRLKYRDGKPHYMQHMPRTKEYLKRALTHPRLASLKHWYRENLQL